MTIELSRALFERLVKLYLVGIALIVPIIAYELLAPEWVAFDAGYLGLLAIHFGWNNDQLAYWLPLIGLFVVHIGSAIGLLSLKRWARSGFWFSIVAAMVFDAVVGPPATYVSGPTALLDFTASTIFGAIVLLSYARGEGGEWFRDQRTATG